MPMNATFDANQHEPKQTGGKHPVGNKFPFTITGTDIKDTKEGGGKKYFEVTFTSPAGSIRNNYNLWNDSKQAVEIAVGQLSALCHATGIFKVDFNNDGAALRGGKGMMDVNFQAGQEPSADKPEGGYVEVKKIYDINGNEPGNKSQQQSSSGFGNQQSANVNPNPNTAQQNWGGGQPQTQQPNVQQNWGGGTQQQSNASGSWQQGGGTEAPPWTQNK